MNKGFIILPVLILIASTSIVVKEGIKDVFMKFFSEILREMQTLQKEVNEFKISLRNFDLQKSLSNLFSFNSTTNGKT